MTARRKDLGEEKPSNPRPYPPATTPEGREMQLAAAAFDLAERQLLEGTASAQVITHFLKFGSAKNKLEELRLRNENLLLEARVKQIASTSQNSELYEQTIEAMKIYTGEDSGGDPDDFY